LSPEAARLLALELGFATLPSPPSWISAAHEVSPIRYGQTELEEDRRTLADLGL